MSDETRKLPRFLASPQSDWAMPIGERAAFEGLLSSLKPTLAIEIGTLKGGSLERLSAHSEVVHSFDLARHPGLTAERFPNVVFHTGDSHELLPKALAEFAEAGQNVDFAFVDGDHSTRGARQDLEDLLSSPSVGCTIILLHDTLNERVRAGFEALALRSHEKVAYVDLDLVPGRPWDGGGSNESRFWNGLGLVAVGYEGPDDADGPRPVEAFPIIFEAFRRSAVPTHEHSFDEYALLEQRISTLEGLLESMRRSLSWRLTSPLRSAKSMLRP